jgi:hypothetical protein
LQRHFVSFPKSGRTWIRYILTQLEIASLIRFHHDGFEFNDGAKPPLDFNLPSRLARYSHIDKLVYLERDPRDVMVSLYSQVTGRFRDFFGYRGTISEFIRDGYFGAENLMRFRELWSEITDRHGFLVISYEECHDGMVESVHKVLDYYELAPDRERIAKAVANATFQKMRVVEESGEFRFPWLKLRNGSPKVRRGKVGGFRDTLCAEDIDYLNLVFRISS